MNKLALKYVKKEPRDSAPKQKTTYQRGETSKSILEKTGRPIKMRMGYSKEKRVAQKREL